MTVEDPVKAAELEAIMERNPYNLTEEIMIDVIMLIDILLQFLTSFKREKD